MGREDQGINNNLHRWQTIPRTLCFVTFGSGAERQVLLLRGAPTKRVWPNRLNGVGGHIERNEDFLSATLREVHEETGLTVAQPRLAGIVHIDSGADCDGGVDCRGQEPKHCVKRRRSIRMALSCAITNQRSR